MNRTQLIKDFRSKAEAAGKPFTAVPAKRGVRVRFDGRSVTLPYHSGEIRDSKLFARRLGLNAQTLSRA